MHCPVHRYHDRYNDFTGLDRDLMYVRETHRCECPEESIRYMHRLQRDLWDEENRNAALKKSLVATSIVCAFYALREPGVPRAVTATDDASIRFSLLEPY